LKYTENRFYNPLPCCNLLSKHHHHEGGEGNELEYDEFLLRDNDFGSDADSDGEAIAAATIQRREGIETLGPRFIFPNDQSQNSRTAASASCAIRLDREFKPIVCSDREKDVVRFVFIVI
jgi:hypothetical protein